MGPFMDSGRALDLGEHVKGCNPWGGFAWVRWAGPVGVSAVLVVFRDFHRGDGCYDL